MLDVRCLLNRPCLKLSSLHHRRSEAVPEHGSSHRFDRSVQTAGSPLSARGPDPRRKRHLLHVIAGFDDYLLPCQP